MPLGKKKVSANPPFTPLKLSELIVLVLANFAPNQTQITVTIMEMAMETPITVTIMADPQITATMEMATATLITAMVDPQIMADPQMETRITATPIMVNWV